MRRIKKKERVIGILSSLMLTAKKNTNPSGSFQSGKKHGLWHAIQVIKKEWR